MKKNLPPLNWLRAFEASARHLSFTHASTELNLTQAAISHQIKGLECQLGSVLFKRLPRGLELTDAGAAYLPAVHESVERLKAATEEIFGQGQNNLLTVKINMVFFMRWLAPCMKEFRKLHPKINLRVTSNIWLDNKETSGDCDLEVRYGRGKWPSVQCDRLTRDELFPVCSPCYLEENGPLESPKDLANHSVLHVIGYQEGWGYWLKQTKHSDVELRQSYQFDTLVTALEMAALGEGVALGRTSLVENALKSGQLVAPLENRVPTEEAFYLVYSNTSLEHPHAVTFRNWLLNVIHEG
ncbi:MULTISPECIES: transcriptional regulator GcvA [unclassified Pseudovibrio]|uniref:transcriptional regulator GcvA n=1 Tax=unclassified Pseudovibrio TaxID=2627060 RepID=UPI0007AE3941|nr:MULTISPECIES: transcriptional regulator GcvA [unclassified Pseudovibrio]KZL02391.1 Glycine cleavage system transcriptional activator [Pseudovibrio sp. W74]KZL08065.1 Glycine cleavage system transcriptional activator [Pseudovibrio sp. Ad14]